MLKTTLKYVLGIAFAIAGANHFVMTDFYLSIMPPYLPLHLFLVYLSGVIECTWASTSTEPPVAGRAISSPGIRPSIVSSMRGPVVTNERPRLMASKTAGNANPFDPVCK